MRLHRTLPPGQPAGNYSIFHEPQPYKPHADASWLLALVLLVIFTATGSSIEAILDRAIARNAQLQSQAMRLALEQALEETRNQPLILAAGSMDQRTWPNA